MAISETGSVEAEKLAIEQITPRRRARRKIKFSQKTGASDWPTFAERSGRSFWSTTNARR